MNNQASMGSVLRPVNGGENPTNERQIGALLIDAGKLKIEDVEPILRVQREHGMRFGEAAVKLGLASELDIEMALSRQFDYPYLRRNNSGLSEELVAAYQPFSQQVENLRRLRSQLMLRWFDNVATRKTVAVVSSARKEGRSFIAANLAVVFSQLGAHTLLIDADMRNPRQHELFRLNSCDGLPAMLSGRGNPDLIQRVPGLVDLSVLPAGAKPPNPQELLVRPLFGRLLEELAGKFNVIIIDTPAGDEYADVHTIAARAGGVLMVTRKDCSRLRPAQTLLQDISGTGATVIGAIINSF